MTIGYYTQEDIAALNVNAHSHALLALKSVVGSSLDYSRGPIAAIKKVRELTGWGLKESKDYVEQLAKQFREQSPNANQPSLGTVAFTPRGKGWLVTYKFEGDYDYSSSFYHDESEANAEARHLCERASIAEVMVSEVTLKGVKRGLTLE